MNKKTGIMQGRLLPKYKNRYQAHPLGYWEDEFPIASKLGLDSIEFILDYNDIEQNPLVNNSGIKKILQVQDITGVRVRSICADYLMEAPIHGNNNKVIHKSLNILEQLIFKSSLLKVSDIVIPCLEKFSLKNKNFLENFIINIKSISKIAEDNNVNLSLETDLEPSPFAKLIETIGSKNVTVNYDIGNSAANGYDPVEEFNAYGEKITDLHIKDRLIGKGPVILGTGNADIPKVFDLLSKYDYQGVIIFQAFRDEEGIKIFKKQQKWFHENIKL
tara:strand:- start:481 stop:1305 length:825 start_codon:yes stop_codon:yes gene_type:complete